LALATTPVDDAQVQALDAVAPVSRRLPELAHSGENGLRVLGGGADRCGSQKPENDR